MATTQTDQYEALTSVATDAIQARVGDTGGKLRVLWFAHTCESETDGSLIRLTILPAGARVLDVVMYWEDLSTGSPTLTIATEASGALGTTIGFVTDAGTAATVPTSVVYVPTAEVPDQGFGYRTPTQVTIVASPGGASLNTGKFWGAIYYTVD
jgi:hypothetical protein